MIEVNYCSSSSCRYYCSDSTIDIDLKPWLGHYFLLQKYAGRHHSQKLCTLFSKPFFRLNLNCVFFACFFFFKLIVQSFYDLTLAYADNNWAVMCVRMFLIILINSRFIYYFFICRVKNYSTFLEHSSVFNLDKVAFLGFHILVFIILLSIFLLSLSNPSFSFLRIEKNIERKKAGV